MPRTRSAILLLAACLASCSYDATAPRTVPEARLSVLAPLRAGAAYGVIPVNDLRLSLERTSGQMVLDTTIAVNPTSDSLVIDLTIPLTLSGPGVVPTERLVLRAALTDSVNSTLFMAGPDTIDATAGGAVNQVAAVFAYVGVGSNAASLGIGGAPGAPVLSGTSTVLTAAALDSGGSPLPGTPVLWSSLDPGVATVARPDSGRIVMGPQASGQARIVARSLTGQADTVTIGVRWAGGQLSVGLGRACAIDGAGVALCWGANTYGQMGSGDTLSSSAPVPVQGGLTFVAITTGHYHTCGLTASGVAYCWGGSWAGGLGDGSPIGTTQLTPVPVSGGLTFSQIRAGWAHTCGITTGGEGYCWGYAGSGLGNGTLANVTVPTAISGGHNFVAMAVGGQHNCGIVNTGETYCWGRNEYGEIGDGGPTGTHERREVPVLVAGGHTFTDISVSFLDETCATTTTGDTYCWGRNHIGQLADGTTTDRSVPALVAGGPALRSVSGGLGGTDSFCATNATGLAYCWGSGRNGQLGDGAALDRTAPVAVAGAIAYAHVSVGLSTACGMTGAYEVYCWGSGTLGDGDDQIQESPVPVSGGLSFADLAVGITAACGVTTDATVCWGGNSGGELGNGTLLDSPVPTNASTPVALAQVEMGGTFACGLDASGNAYCWGANDSGQLGDGSNARSSTPVAVSGGLAFSSLSPGQQHTCGVTTTGLGHCWGYGFSGQLGAGTTASSTTPVPVSGGLTFAEIGTGSSFSCGLTVSGSAYCWGGNSSGRLGDGTTVDSSVPVPVSGALTFTRLDVGSSHACAVAAGGAMYCWGLSSGGALGSGVVSASVPTQVSGGLTFTDVSAGNEVTCAIATGGGAYCWGLNNFGQLGDGTTTNAPTPSPVAGGLSVTRISVGSGATCAIASGGAAYCWGQEGAGRLGNGSVAYSAVPVRVQGL